MKKPSLANVYMALVPFILLGLVYFVVSQHRLQINPDEKFTPSIVQMTSAFWKMATNVDKATETILLWEDTWASLRRIGLGLGAGAIAGLFFAILMGLSRTADKMLQPFARFLAIIPPLSILPILLIIFGAGELGKVVLIYIGTTFIIALDMYNRVKMIHTEEIIKTRTLGGSTFEIAKYVVVPKLMPTWLESIRTNLGPAWLFVIAAESISATEGLGYRIFLMQRYLAMDVIIPYVIWITLIGYFMITVLDRIINWRYPWYRASGFKEG